MKNQQINAIFSELSTPLIADALVRLEKDLRFAPAGIKSLVPGVQMAGKIIPVKHFGSVDVFFEAMTLAQPGDILVIDNDKRADEGCIGDLTAIEASTFGIAGFIIWGCHRDTKELIELKFPVFSYGSCPCGPTREDQSGAAAFSEVRFGEFMVEQGDVVLADDDGVIFAPGQDIAVIFETAQRIKETERQQVKEIERGNTLHQQFQFDEYLAQQKTEVTYTFRKHLRNIGGAIEE